MGASPLAASNLLSELLVVKMTLVRHTGEAAVGQRLLPVEQRRQADSQICLACELSWHPADDATHIEALCW